MKRMHFAFVACNRNAARFREDPSFVYRCENMAATLRSGGHDVSLFHLTEFPLGHSFDIVIFHRPKHSVRLSLILFYLKCYHQSVLVADFDDLIFDSNFAEFSPGVMNNLVPFKTTKKNYLAHQRAVNCFNLITVSTQPLAEHIETSFPQIKVVTLPNSVHFEWRKTEPEVSKKLGTPVITYFPGTRSHDRDFACIVGPLSRFLSSHPEVHLHITGPLQYDLSGRPGQVSQSEKVPFEQYPELFCTSWVNLAPLETTPFNRCKSALKILEAGSRGVPTIHSPLPDAERFRNVGALKAETDDEWLRYLECMLSPEYYYSVTENLSERILGVADINNTAARLVDEVLSLSDVR